MTKKSNAMIKFYVGFLVFVGFIVLLFLSGCMTPIQTSSVQQEDLQDILDNEWQIYTSDKPNFKGGIAIQVLSPKGDYFISTGMGDSMTNEHHFRIASVTKTFTASGIMLLNQKGLLNINDKITDNIPGTNIPYVPDTLEYDIPYKDNITIRMLLMHRAGIFDLSNTNIPDNEFSHNEPFVGQNYLEYIESQDKEHTFTFDELIGINAKNKLSYFEPGSSYHYSDTGYSLLGKIIERVSGKSYSDFIKDELLVPNNLLDTTLPTLGSDQTLPAPFVNGYIWSDENTVMDVTHSNMAPHVAEGNIISTPKDLANWGKLLFEGKAGLTKETVEMMKSGMFTENNSNSKYGLGISYQSETNYGHSGAHEGYLTLLSYNPETGVIYVTFANIWNCQNGITLDSIISELVCMSTATNKIIEKIGY
jgi:D-alanyl-D-alanine carboxypeptidase